MYSRPLKVDILADLCMPEPGWPNMVKMRNWPTLLNLGPTIHFRDRLYPDLVNIEFHHDPVH